MALGVPTVAFDTPVAREYLGPYGLFAARGNVDSLAETLQQALFDRESTGRLGECLRQRAIDQFEWSMAGKLIVDAYAEACGDTAIAGEQTRERTTTSEA
jgi:glycosyltransferase involved in cell wall biosynthesis